GPDPGREHRRGAQRHGYQRRRAGQDHPRVHRLREGQSGQDQHGFRRYRGVAPATTDLLGGRIQVLFDTLPAAIANIRAGKIRALAVTSKKRVAALPDLPAINEFVPGFEADSFHGISAPKGTPREIVEKLNADINAVLADPKIKKRLADL